MPALLNEYARMSLAAYIPYRNVRGAGLHNCIFDHLTY